jgi:hypothetical protein
MFLGAMVTLLLVLQWTQSASAQEAWDYGGNGIGVSDHAPGVPGSPGGGPPSVGPDGGERYYAFWTLGWSDAGWCRLRRYTTDPALAAAYNYGDHRQFAAGNAQGNASECPADAQPAVTALPTPDVLAQDFWDVRLLPTPTLHMSPDYAVTGKPVYLEIGGDQRLHFDVANPIGPAIAIDTTSRYVIDWGDGTVETSTSRGGPWPDGDLTHVYTTSADARTIRVAQHWSATWQAGAAQGTLESLQTAATLTFRVTQVQAVRS